MNKQELRLNMQRIRASIPDRDRQSRNTCQHLMNSKPYAQCDVLLVYLAIGTELSLDSVIQDALQREKRVAAPRIMGPHTMEFRELKKNIPLERGRFHTWQPPEASPKPDVSGGHVLMLVPGLAFDDEGYRLGYGGGYYDAYLKNTNILALGMSFVEQIIPRVPREAHDQRLQGIATAGGLLFL